ncbi:MAG: response regulator [Bacteroidota bacterium]
MNPLLYVLLVLGLLVWMITWFYMRRKERKTREKIASFEQLAHDIRTPLTLIKAPLMDLLANTNLPEDSRSKLELMKKHADRLHLLINQVKYVSTHSLLHEGDHSSRPSDIGLPDLSLPSEKFPFTILIAEDHQELRKYLSSNLKDSYTILEAENGQKALSLAKEQMPDIIVSDVMMPIMGGRGLCTHIKENIETSHIPVILLTVLDSLDAKLKGIGSGADVYLEKPFEMSVLKAYIQNLILIRQRLKNKFLHQDQLPLKAEYVHPTDHDFMEKIIALIILHLDDANLSVDLLCQEMGMSRPVVFRKLKSLTGENIQGFIKIIRLKKAKELLQQGGKTVSEIAYETGFSNPKYFSTSFKKHFGQRPSELLFNNK